MRGTAMYKVVIIDDEPLIVEGLSRSIPWERWNCKVVGFGYNGIEGMEVIRREKPAIVISDISMPKMDGLQATRAIRAMQAERPDAEEIPIIAVSANAFAEDVQTSLDAGMNGHISKPLNVADVAKVIARNRNKV